MRRSAFQFELSYSLLVLAVVADWQVVDIAISQRRTVVVLFSTYPDLVKFGFKGGNKQPHSHRTLRDLH